MFVKKANRIMRPVGEQAGYHQHLLALAVSVLVVAAFVILGTTFSRSSISSAALTDGMAASGSVTGFDKPQDVAIDEVHHRLFISDYGRHRVLVYNLTTANALADQVADFVLGQPDFSTMSINTTNSVNGCTSTPNACGMQYPRGLLYEGIHDRLFVSDNFNHRVLVFDVSSISNGEAAQYVLGQPSFSSSAPSVSQSGINNPVGMTYDDANNRLFLIDSGNHRVLVFDADTLSNGKAATYELGQLPGASAFTTNVAATTAGGLSAPQGVVYDNANKRLYVSDYSNNRVLVFNLTSITSGQAAEKVLGQSDFTTNTANTKTLAACTTAINACGMDGPYDVAYDSVNKRIFVALAGANNRVLVFDVATINDGEQAVNVIGQPNFTTGSAGSTTSELNLPDGAVFDNSSGRLYVSDYFNNRVLYYDVAITDTAPPVVTYSVPAAAATVSGNAVGITVSANDASVPISTTLTVPCGTLTNAGGATQSITSSGGFATYTWDTTACADGSQTLSIIGTDSASSPNTSTAVTRSVTVNNTVAASSTGAFTTNPANVVGWAWNSVVGWIKMRGDVVGAGSARVGSYGVTVNKDTSGTMVDGIVSGWSWSSNYGWICWGITCADPSIGGSTPPGGSWETRVANLYGAPSGSGPVACRDSTNTSCYNVTGWAKVVQLGDNGLISLSGSAGSDTYQLQFQSDISEFRGWAWNGGGGLSIGWIAFSGATIASNPANGTPGGACGDASLGQAPCAVSFDNGRSTWATQIIDKWIQTRGGSIYSQNGFSDLSSPTPVTNNKFSADYLIHSPTDVGQYWVPACKSSATGDTSLPNCADIVDPDAAFDDIATPGGGGVVPKRDNPPVGNNYSNALGTINVTALMEATNRGSATLTNLYGYKTKTLSADGNELLSIMQGQALDNTVYVHDDAVNPNVTINYSTGASPDPVRTFSNAPNGGSSTIKSGAGTVIVKGDIIFKRSLVYPSASPVDSVKKLASVAWIAVKRDDGTGGNIIIDNCLDPVPGGSFEPAMLVGTFIAEGGIHTGTGEGGSGAAQCSSFKTVTDLTDPNDPSVVIGTRTDYFNVALHILGTMMAKHFYFERKQVDYERGSELIDADGRVTVNTPPGLDDFVKQLPRWRTAGF